MKPASFARLGLAAMWLFVCACEIRGQASEISFEKSCYSAIQDTLLTVNAQIRDEAGAGTGEVKVRPLYTPNAEGLKVSNDVLTPGVKVINTFAVEGIVSIEITPSAQAVGREYFLTLQTTDGPTASASTTIRVQSMADSDRCAGVR